MVINQKFFGADSIFSIITTVVMVFVSIFTPQEVQFVLPGRKEKMEKEII